MNTVTSRKIMAGTTLEAVAAPSLRKSFMIPGKSSSKMGKAAMHVHNAISSMTSLLFNPRFK
jgi:hypothetical protein